MAGLKSKLKAHLGIVAVAFVIVGLAAVGVLYALPFFSGYTYQSHFDEGDSGVLTVGGFQVDPQYISGSASIENGMLKIVSNNRYNVQIGINWATLDYRDGSDDYPVKGWMPWLGAYWKYHCEVTFVLPSGATVVPYLSVEYWMAYASGYSYSCLAVYDNGVLSYTHGAFPAFGGYAVPLGQFSVPQTFTAIIDADFHAHTATFNWSGHVYTVPEAVEPVGFLPKNMTFGQFNIRLEEPGVIYVKNLKVVLSDLT